MTDMTLPRETVEEVAALLGRPAREIKASDIVNALRQGGQPEDQNNGDTARNAEQVRTLEELLQPIHDAVTDGLAKTIPGRRILAARQDLETVLAEIDGRERDGGLDRRVARHEKTVLLDEFQREHERELLAAAADHAGLLPSPERLLQVARPAGDDSWRQWIFEVVPFKGILLRPPKDSDKTPPSQGVVTPAPPPPVDFCMYHPFSTERTHEDAEGVTSDMVLVVDTVYGSVAMEPDAWSPGSISGARRKRQDQRARRSVRLRGGRCPRLPIPGQRLGFHVHRRHRGRLQNRGRQRRWIPR
jgi:hypothetical protein